RIPLRVQGKAGRIAAARIVRRRRPAASRGVHVQHPAGRETGDHEAARGIDRAARVHRACAGRSEPLEHRAERRMESARAQTRGGSRVRSFFGRPVSSRHLVSPLAAGQGAAAMHAHAGRARSPVAAGAARTAVTAPTPNEVPSRRTACATIAESIPRSRVVLLDESRISSGTRYPASSESTCARTRSGKSRRRYAQAIHPGPHVGLARTWRTSLAFSATALIVVDETGERGNAISFRTR